jgi:hypothetical protein
MGVLEKTKKLIENRLKTLSPALAIAFDNVVFTPPANAGKYLRCTFNIQRPDDTSVGSDYYRENVTVNIYVMDKLNIGTGSALDTAEDIRTLFKKSTSLQDENVRITILRTPHIAGTTVTSDRLVCPISIQLLVENT